MTPKNVPLVYLDDKRSTLATVKTIPFSRNFSVHKAWKNDVIRNHSYAS